MNSMVTVLMITMAHMTTGIPTVRYRPDQLVGNSVVGTIVTDDVLPEDVTDDDVIDDVMPTQAIIIHTMNNVILYNIQYCTLQDM